MIDSDRKWALTRAIAKALGYSFDQGHGRATGAACEIIDRHLSGLIEELQSDRRTRMVDTGEAEAL